MKFLKIITTILLLFLASCNNKVDTQVPSEIKVDVPETTQTINVVHSVEVSVQMEQFFRSSCITQVDSLPVPLPEPERSKAIDTCVSNSVQQFIQNMLALINQNSNQGQN